MSNTILEDNKEKELLDLLEPIIEKYAKELNTSSRYLKHTISYLWDKEAKEADERWENYLSANEIGPYGGR